MPKVSVYLPDDLYRSAKEHDLPISKLTQDALRRALEGKPNEAWVRRMRERLPGRCREFDTSALMDEVRDEFGA
jgi:post-segregation antitoxin (ccd killing protein)